MIGMLAGWTASTVPGGKGRVRRQCLGVVEDAVADQVAFHAPTEGLACLVDLLGERRHVDAAVRLAGHVEVVGLILGKELEELLERGQVVGRGAIVPIRELAVHGGVREADAGGRLEICRAPQAQ